MFSRTSDMAATTAAGSIRWARFLTLIWLGVIFCLFSMTGAARAVTYTLEIGDVSVNEADGTAQFTVSISPSIGSGVTTTVSADYTTADNSALAGSDYTSASGTLQFTEGETQETFTVTINDDVFVEDDEVFYGEISSPAVIGGPGGDSVNISDDQGECTITDNDHYHASITSVSPASTSEANTNMTFTITLDNVDPADGVTGGDVVVSYQTDDGEATAGSDYTDNDGSVTFSDGSTTTSQTVNVAVQEDSYVEPDENFDFQLTGISGTGNTYDNTAETATIENDDSYQVYIQFISDTTPTEGTDSDVTFRIAILSANIDPARGVVGTTTVDYAVTGGSAEPADYSLPGTSVTLENGFPSREVDVGIVDDTLAEGTETFDFELTGLSGDYAGAIFGDNPRTISIQDNDYDISISGSPSVEEGNQVSFTVTVDPQVRTGDTVTVDYSTSDDTAEEPGDYTAESNTTLTFTEGESSENATVTTIDDGVVEDTEAFTVSLSNATTTSGSVTISDPGPATATITDNDAYVISSLDNPEVTEGDSASFSITISPTVATGHEVTVQFRTMDSSAQAPGDYASHSGTVVTFQGGDDSKEVAVVTNDDSIVEAEEYFWTDLSNAASSVGSVSINDAGNADQRWGRINDNDTAQVSIQAIDDTAGEPDGSGLFRVSLDNQSSTDTVVSYNVGGDATPNSDYTALTGSVTIQAGDTEADIDVSVIDDSLVEEDETVVVTLTGITGGDTDISIAAAPDDTATVTIPDNDTAVFTIDDPTVNESAGTMTFTVSLDHPLDTDVDVDVAYADVTATGGTDYDSAADQVTFAAGDTADKTVTVAITNDNVVEEDETFTASLSPATSLGTRSVNTTDDGTGTIADDDTAVFTIDDATVSMTTITFTVSLSKPLDMAVDVDVDYTDVTATGSSGGVGADYDNDTDTVTFAAGDTADKTVTVAVTNDSLVEETETFTAHLSTPTDLGERSADFSDTGTGTIPDNDTAEVSIAATITPASEPDNDGQFTVSMDNQSSTPTVVSYTVSGDATPGSDYTALTGSVTIPAETSSAVIDVDVGNDNLVEDDETVVVTLTGISSGDADITIDGSNDEATVTIQDDDAAQVSIEAVDDTAAEPNGSGRFRVSMTNQSDTPTVVDYTVSGDATPGSDYTALSGTVTIPAETDSANIHVTVVDDSLVEEDETVTVTLDAISTGDADVTIGSPSNDTVNITDNDAYTVGITHIAPDPAVEGTDATVTFTVVLGNVDPAYGVLGTVEADYDTSNGSAEAGADFTDTNGTLSFTGDPASGVTKIVDVPILNDDLVEANETFRFGITDITGIGSVTGDNPAEATIQDNPGDDVYNAYIQDIDPSGVTESQGPVRVTIALENVADNHDVIGDVYVDYTTNDGTAAAPADYASTAGTAHFTGSTSSVTVNVPITDDNLVEAAEQFTFELTHISGTGNIGSIIGTNPGTIEVYDDDAYLISVGDVTPSPVSEDGSPTVYFEVGVGNVDPAYTPSVNIAYYTEDNTAVSGVTTADYVAVSGSLTISGTTGIPVQLLDDEVDEALENFFLVVDSVSSNAVLGDDRGECVILDDELVITATAGEGGTITTTISGTTTTIGPDETYAFGAEEGEDKTFRIEVLDEEYYDIEDVLIDGESVGDIAGADSYEYTFTNVIEDHTIEAVFTHYLKITASAGAGGTINPDGDVYVEEGTNYRFEVNRTPNSCNVIDDVLVDGVSVDDLDSRAVEYQYTFRNVQENHTIDAQFVTAAEFVIAARAEYGGTIDPSGQVSVTCGDSQSFDIEAGTDNWIEQVFVDGVPAPGIPSGATTYTYTFSDVRGDHYINVEFGLPPGACEDISDIPLDALVRAAPPAIMFLLDDSGSMDWEFMTQQDQGVFEGEYFVFDNAGDNNYSDGYVIGDAERRLWQGQWSGYNKIYYNPEVTYTPWADPAGPGDMPDADPDTPRSNPVSATDTQTFDLDGTYVTLYPRSQMVTVTRDCSYLCDDHTCADAVALFLSGTSPAFSTRVAADDDDAEEYSSGNVYEWSGDLDMVCDGYEGGAVGIRFRNVVIPPGSITNAYIEFTASADESGSDDLTIEGEEAANPVAFSDANSVTGRSRTDESVDWSPAAWTDGEVYQTPDLSDIVEDILDETAFTDGNAMVFIITGDACRKAYSHDGSSSAAPRLVIETDQTSAPIVIDNQDALFETEGSWNESSGTPEWDGSSLYTNDDGAVATWTIDNIPTGDYDVYAWASATDSGRSRQAVYNIYYNSGGSSTAQVLMDQREPGDGGHAGEWYPLGTYHFVEEPGSTSLDVPRSHYYVRSGTTPYLVTLSGVTNADAADGGGGDISYYRFDDANDNDTVDWGELVELTEAQAQAAGVAPRNPDGTYRTYTEERQNFANWYSFYRKRELAAKAAVGRVIDDVSNAYIGLYSIHERVNQSVLAVGVSGVTDYRDSLQTTLYTIDSTGGTPLRQHLEDVGQYFDCTDGNDGNIGDSPYMDAGEGNACRQVFTIAMTDGYWNGGDPYFGMGPPGTGDNKDGDLEGDPNAPGDFDGPPYADDHFNTLADVAMYYYEKDLSDEDNPQGDDPGLDDELPDTMEDGAVHQHMVTYGVSFGLTGSLDPDDYDEDLVHKVTHTQIAWPEPDCYACPRKIDDLWHAAENGRGMFMSASDPTELVDALVEIMKNIAERQGSASSLSVNGDELWETVGDETRVFQASYSTGNMTGEVKAFSVDIDSGEVDEDNPVWMASGQLNSRVDTAGHGDRIIASYNPDSNTGFPFTYTGVSTYGSATQIAALQPDWSPSADANMENMIHFLRGDDTYEGNEFRNRASILGDIVHSSPLHMDEVLYVGGNDGMLHAFSALTGAELFCYVPGLVYDNLKDLGNPDYKHKFFVDLTPVAQSGVTISGTQSTILVGGLGKGGKGYYALDITPASGTTTYMPADENELAGNVLWEYPRSGTTVSEVNNVGYSYSRPFIVKSNSTAYPWIIGFGNGYNSGSGHAVLILLDPETGTMIRSIDTGMGNCNGLSTPVPIDDNLDGKADYVYAGDLKGNVWKFDLTSTDPSLWDSAYMSGTTPQPLFQARGPGGAVQPITTSPDIMKHCDKGGYMVIVGTGKYLNEYDLESGVTQTVYGIWDYGDETDEYLGVFQRGAVSGVTPQLSNQPLSYDVRLLEQTVVWEDRWDADGDGLDDEDPYVRVLSANEADWGVTTDYFDSVSGTTVCGEPPLSIDEDDLGEPCDPSGLGTDPDPTGHAGWFVDLAGASGNHAAERVVDGFHIRLGKVVFNTYTPEDSMCSAGGFSWIMENDACNGGRLAEPQFDLNGDGHIDENDLVNIGTVGDPIWVPPTGLKYPGRLLSPIFLRLPGKELEVKIFSTTLNNTVTTTLVKEKAAKLGIVHWMEKEPR